MPDPSNKYRRVFVGFNETAGYYFQIAEGFRELGFSVRQVNLYSHHFGYEEGASDFVAKALKRSFTRGDKALRCWEWLSRCWNRIVAIAVSVGLALRYDFFVFANGITFSDHTKFPVMWLIRIQGKKVVIVFNGTDSRAPYCGRTGLEHSDGSIRRPKEIVDLINRTRSRVEKAHSEANVVVSTTLTCHFHTGRYFGFLHAGLPAPQIEGGKPIERQEQSARILHCPSNRGIKGSNEINRVIARLKREGALIEFIQLVDVPNSRVIEELGKCDFVIDQLFSDTPMSGFPSEAAVMKKAAIVGGYAWQELESRFDEKEFPPTIRCHPDRLYECLLEFLSKGREHWKAKGVEAFNFVSNRWSRRACAERLCEAACTPERVNGWIDPGKGNYLWGCGVHASETLEMAQLLSRIYGSDSFSIKGKKELKTKSEQLGTMDLSLEAKLKENEAEQLALQLKAAVDRNAAIHARYEEQVELLEAKVANFRGMIERRNRKIEKLQVTIEKLRQRRS